MGVVWCLAFFPWFRDDPAQVRSVNAAELRLIQADGPPESGSHGLPPGFWTRLLTCRSLWAMGILYVCGSFGWSFFVSWMPRFLKEVHGVEYAKSELMSGLPLFFGGISCLVGGVLSDALVRRTGRKWLGRAVFPLSGYTVAAAAMYCVRFAKTPEQATTLMCLAMAGFDFGQGANWATVVDIGGRFAGTAAGFINMVGNAGNYLQPYLGAMVFRTLGWDVLFGVYSAAFLAAAVLWLLIDPERRFYEKPEPGAG